MDNLLLRVEQEVGLSPIDALCRETIASSSAMSTVGMLAPATGTSMRCGAQLDVGGNRGAQLGFGMCAAITTKSDEHLLF